MKGSQLVRKELQPAGKDEEGSCQHKQRRTIAISFETTATKLARFAVGSGHLDSN